MADIVHDFGSNPISWSPTSGSLTFDATGDLVDDFEITVTSGYIDTVTSLFVIDNNSTSSSGIEKTFAFSISSLNPGLPTATFNLLGFDFYSEKNIEVGGKGGAGAISVDVFDDLNAELVNGVNISGSLGSAPTNVTLPPDITTEFFVLAVDLDTPPNNDDAQVVLGDIVFNGGTVVASAASAPEPTVMVPLLGAVFFLLVRRERKPVSYACGS